VERLKRMSQTALTGPRGKLVEKVEAPIARRTPLSRHTIRSLIGAVFLFLSVLRVYRAIRAGLR
jgi:hypothetical protein